MAPSIYSGEIDNPVFNTVRKTLRKQFIHCDEIAMVLASGLSIKENIVLWGDGGYGKTEMVKCLIDRFDNIKSDCYIKSLTEETTIAELFGGINIKKLNDEGVLEYNVENSFMNFKFVVLEEGLSCPSNVLAALRDILSSGQFRNGTQTFTIRTEVVIICTNVNPMEVASESTSAEALLQRFPLVFEVKWNTHNIEDFINLFGKQVNRMDTGNEALLAGMIVEAINKGQKISPRVALKAYRLVMGQRNMRNATTTNPDDFLVLQFMQPFKDSIKEFVATIEDRRREAIIAAGFNALCIKIRSIIKVLSKMKSDDYIQFFTTEKSVEPLLSEVQKYTVSDKLFAEKAALAMEVKDVISYLHNSGMEALNKVTSAIVAGPVVIEEPDVVSGDDEDSGIDDKNFTI